MELHGNYNCLQMFAIFFSRIFVHFVRLIYTKLLSLSTLDRFLPLWNSVHSSKILGKQFPSFSGWSCSRTGANHLLAPVRHLAASNIKSSCQNGKVPTQLHPWKLTCPQKRDYFNRKYIFQPSFFRGYVSFQGGISVYFYGTLELLRFLAMPMPIAKIGQCHMKQHGNYDNINPFEHMSSSDNLPQNSGWAKTTQSSPFQLYWPLAWIHHQLFKYWQLPSLLTHFCQVTSPHSERHPSNGCRGFAWATP